MSLTVSLVQYPSNPATQMAKHAAGVCKNPHIPQMGAPGVDVRKGLFQVSHHTTLAHTNLTFAIDGLSVNGFTFGAHLANIYYNSDQRSGRFCNDMFGNPDILALAEHMQTYWSLDTKQLEAALNFIKKGLHLYASHLDESTQLMKLWAKEERPYIKADMLEKSGARNFAQEQLRMLVPTIFPSGTDITLSLTAIFSLWHTAHSPEMRALTDKMRDIVLELWPDIDYMFDEKSRRAYDFVPKFEGAPHLTSDPVARFIGHTGDFGKIIVPDEEDMSPVDLLPYRPKYMDNNGIEVHSEIEYSVATMGQDQRHRSIRRTEPRFTGGFYMPPVIEACVPKDIVLEYMEEWYALRTLLPESLVLALAPYGAVVQYRKFAPINAFAHEQAKRACKLAQGEIRKGALLLRESILASGVPDAAIAAELIGSPCCRNGGTCTEGVYYCGISLAAIRSGDLSACFGPFKV